MYGYFQQTDTCFPLYTVVENLWKVCGNVENSVENLENFFSYCTAFMR